VISGLHGAGPRRGWRARERGRHAAADRNGPVAAGHRRRHLEPRAW